MVESAKNLRARARVLENAEQRNADLLSSMT